MCLGTCDYGYAWADKAYAVDSGHQLSECSSAGLCNRGTGVCECYAGFTGQACEKGKFLSGVKYSCAIFAFVHNRLCLIYDMW
jgi:hypothetical protein